MSKLQPGLVFETISEVTRKESARELGSGTLEILGTPAMALFVEQACLGMVESYLKDGQTTVGVQLRLHHLAPTPLGDKVRVKAEVVGVEEHLIYFKATIWDSMEIIGDAEHQRAIIDIERFQRRVAKKSSSLSTDSLLSI